MWPWMANSFQGLEVLFDKIYLTDRWSLQLNKFHVIRFVIICLLHWHEIKWNLSRNFTRNRQNVQNVVGGKRLWLLWWWTCGSSHWLVGLYSCGNERGPPDKHRKRSGHAWFISRLLIGCPVRDASDWWLIGRSLHVKYFLLFYTSTRVAFFSRFRFESRFVVSRSSGAWSMTDSIGKSNEISFEKSHLKWHSKLSDSNKKIGSFA